MRLRLFWKLGLSYLALLLLALTAIYLYTSHIWERHLVDGAYRNLDALARVAEARPPDLPDSAALATWTRWLSRGGARVTVIALDGTVLADSDEDPAEMENHADRTEVRTALAEGRGRATRFSSTVNRDLLYVAARVSWPSTGPVVLRLAQPLGRVSDALRETRAPLTTISILALLVGGGLSLLVSRAFAKRVERLKDFAQRVARGDFRPAPLPEGEDELGELQSSLNQTVEQLAQAIRSVEEERNHSATILSSMSEGVAVVDANERILYSNPAFRRALYSRGEHPLEGRRLVEVTRQREILNMIQEVRKGAGRMEGKITTSGLQPRHFLVRAAPVGEGGALLVVLDVTELERLERVRRDFVANVSHELR
ncbi:MAG: PAS domain-containing protein, partial [Vicinamibacteria bacterium]